MNYRRITSSDANSTVTVTTADAVLKRIVVNTTSAHALTVKDGQGATLASIKASVAEQSLEYDIDCSGGITITVPASYAGDATVVYI